MYKITDLEIKQLQDASEIASRSPVEAMAYANVRKQISEGESRDFYLGFASALKMIAETSRNKTQLEIVAVLMKRTVEFL